MVRIAAKCLIFKVIPRKKMNRFADGISKAPMDACHAHRYQDPQSQAHWQALQGG